MGASGRRMIEAMIAGVRDPRKLAALAGRGVKATPKELYDALHGRLTDHHRFLLRGRLGQWDALGASIKVVDDEVDARAARMDMGGERADKARFSDLIRQLESIPGVSKLSALTILSETGFGHEPLRHGRPLGCLVGLVSRPERKRRQAQAHATAQGRPLAEDHARPVRLGGQAGEQ
jgi:transposase